MKRFRGLVIFLILFTIVGGAVVAANRATSSPDSSGITMVKEDWRAAGDGIFIR